MAKFDYTGVTAGIRDNDWETWLEAAPQDVANTLAGIVGLTDVGADGDWDVVNDSNYNELLTQTRGFYKKVK